MNKQEHLRDLEEIETMIKQRNLSIDLLNLIQRMKNHITEQ